jgi:nucleotide-binding universal stress UspA family protein
VLVGVDGSEDALRAVRYGKGFADGCDGELWLVHAVDDGVLTGGWGVMYDPTILAEVGAEALTEAQAWLSSVGFPAERVHAEVMIGHPTAVLADLSEHSRMVVVGRRAQSGLERMFVGSTSVSLAATVHCPLTVISAASTPHPTGGQGRIAVAVTTPERSQRAIEWAFEEARWRTSHRLVVVHVVPPEPKGLFRAKLPPLERRLAAARQEIERVLAPLTERYPDVEVESEVRYGVPIEALIEETSTVDLLILGVHGHPVTGVTFGGVVRGVLAHALAPVCLVR